MSCYQPLLVHMQDMNTKKRNFVSICNVLLVCIGFFLLFFWFSQWQRNHSDSITIEPSTINDPPTWYKSAPYNPYGPVKEDNQYLNANEIIQKSQTTKDPQNITAATLFPAKTTTTTDPLVSQSANSIFEDSETSESQKPCTKRIVGYYNGWDNRELSENQMKKNTHLVLAFVRMDVNGAISFESEQKKTLFLEMSKKAKEVNPGVKVMVSIGGVYNSEHFGKIAGSFKKRGILIASITAFLQEYQFDGVDIFWKWPRRQDKANYIFLLRELREAMEKIQNPESSLISIVSPSVAFELMDGFHLSGILNFVDFVNVETDQSRGPYTSAPAPLYSAIGDFQEYNVDWTMKHMSCVTKNPQKLNMGVPFYGRFWKGVQDSVEKPDAMWRTVEASASGDVATGTVFWRNLESEGFSKAAGVWHEESKTPYIWDSKNRIFLGFENEKSVQEKMKYAMEKNLGGVTIWTLDMDDDADSLLEAVTSTCEKSGDLINQVNYQC